MRILILGINYPPEKIGIAVYTGDLAQSLADAGHSVDVVTTNPYYPAWRVTDGYRRRWWHSEEGRNAVPAVLRCPIYVPKHPSGIRRLVHHASFALSALAPMLWKGAAGRPDLVLCVAPSLLSAPVAWVAARLGGATAWLHVQDFEVSAAVATGLLDGKSRLIRLATRVERFIMRRFDRVSSIGPEMCRRLAIIGVPDERVRQLRNWADLDGVRPQDAPSPYRTAWNVKAPHVALYSGNIANKQGIEIVVAAAERLRHRDDLLFVICGEGSGRQALERETAAHSNILLRDLQPRECLSDLLSLASVHLLPQKSDAADLVLPSKLTNMLASGRPVIATADPGTGLAREVAGCGIVTPPGDAHAFAAAVEKLLDEPDLRARYARGARERAEQDWDRRKIVNAFCTDVTAMIHKAAQ